jgi:hypothetical protein
MPKAELTSNSIFLFSSKIVFRFGVQNYEKVFSLQYSLFAISLQGKNFKLFPSSSLLSYVCSFSVSKPFSNCRGFSSLFVKKTDKLKINYHLKSVFNLKIMWASPAPKLWSVYTVYLSVAKKLNKGYRCYP